MASKPKISTDPIEPKTVSKAAINGDEARLHNLQPNFPAPTMRNQSDSPSLPDMPSFSVPVNQDEAIATAIMQALLEKEKMTLFAKEEALLLARDWADSKSMIAELNLFYNSWGFKLHIDSQHKESNFVVKCSECQRERHSLKHADITKQRKTTTRSGHDCPFVLRGSANSGRYKLSGKLNLDHNHKAAIVEDKVMISLKNLPIDLQNEAIKMLQAGAESKLIIKQLEETMRTKHINLAPHITVCPKSMENAKASVKPEIDSELRGVLKVLNEYEARHGPESIKVFIEFSDSFIVSLFWMTAGMIAMFRANPFAVFIDGTFNCTNSKNFVTPTINSLLNTGRLFLVAIGLVGSESIPNFKWFFHCFNQTVWTKERIVSPLTVLTDCAVLFESLINECFPNSDFIQCFFHWFVNFNKRIKFGDSRDADDDTKKALKEKEDVFLEDFYFVCEAKTATAFNIRLDNLIEKYKGNTFSPYLEKLSAYKSFRYAQFYTS